MATTIVKFRSVKCGLYLTCPDGIEADSLIYCKSSPEPLQFEMQGNIEAMTLRVVGKGLFLSYRGTTGAMKLVSDASSAVWQLQKQGDKYAIRNLAYNDYVWATDSGEAYLTRSGDPTNDDAQWYVDGI